MKSIFAGRKQPNENADELSIKKMQEWGIVTLLIVFLIIAVLIEKNVISLCPWMLQKTGNDNIYQVLIQVQAAMVGIVTAIVALLTNIIDYQTYGLSTAHFIMELKPIFPFKYRNIVIEVILITALNWAIVALGLYNVSVAFFIITVTLFSYLVADVMKVLYSKHSIMDRHHL